MELEEQDVKCLVPENRDANHQNPKATPEYQASAFIYNEKTDAFQCPQGQTMPFHHKNEGGVTGAHQARCDACPAKKDCCPDTMKQGRSVSRSFHTETLNTIVERVASEEGAEMKRARSTACEGAFARIINLLHWKRCSMWGEVGVQSELARMSWLDVPAGK